MNIRKTMYITGFLHHLVYYYDYQEALFISLYACVRGRGLGCTKRTRKKNWLCYRLVLTLHYSISVKFISEFMKLPRNGYIILNYNETKKLRIGWIFSSHEKLLCYVSYILSFFCPIYLSFIFKKCIFWVFCFHWQYKM